MYFQTTHSYFEGGYQETNVYILEDLKSGHTIDGPAIIMNGNRYGEKYNSNALVTQFILYLAVKSMHIKSK